jgi:hypothetical protein
MRKIHGGLFMEIDLSMPIGREVNRISTMLGG